MKRLHILLGGYIAIAAIAAPMVVRPVPRLVWNASASVPIGLYSARPAAKVELGDLVAAQAPPPTARLMAERGYLPLRVAMLKHVAALAGQQVCRRGVQVWIDGKWIADARARDRSERLLPSWQGCRTLRTDEVFLLNPASEGSFDGRYFGPISTRSITAVLTPLWVSDPDPGDAAPASTAHSTRFPTEGKGHER